MAMSAVALRAPSMMRALLLALLSTASALRPIVARRSLVGGAAAVLASIAPEAARADKPDAVSEFKAAAGLRGGPVLNADGEYDEGARAEDWREAWSSRADKASKMSPDEILMAARGAGNAASREGPESAPSRKRRALAGCRPDAIRFERKAGNAKACAARVLAGEVDFMLDAAPG